MKKAIPVIAILGLFMAAHTAQAAAPQLVPVQGVLTDSTGTPIDSTVTAVFSLYTSEVGGTALWTETQSVLVEDGLFTAYMGDVTTLDLSLFRDNGNLWLGIQIGSDAEMDRVMLGSNPFAAYSEWCGNHPTPDFADITGSVDPADLPAGVVVGALSCTGTEKVSGVDSSGALVCSADVDTNTTYTAGSGLTLSGTTFSVNTSGLQTRVTGTCAAGNSIRVINSDGSVVCEPDNDTNTTYTAGYGLTLSGTTFSANTGILQTRVSGTCAAGNSIRQINSDGSVVCEPDTDTNTNAATICASGYFLNGDGTCDRLYSIYTGGSGYRGATLVTGTNYIYPTSGTSVTIASGSAGRCLVNVDTMISCSSGSSGTAPYLRTAHQVGSTNTYDPQYGFYYPEETCVSGSQVYMSRSHLWTGLTAGTTYLFGCFLDSVSGTWVGDSAYCRATVHCW